jgi:hypothetical protein
MLKQSIRVLYLSFFAICSWSVHACEVSEVGNKLLVTESNHLLKNPKAFAHGWQDGEISLKFENLTTSGEACLATMILTIPQRDLDQVSAHLDQHPAKRILLGAQGYSIPSNTVIEVPYQFASADQEVVSQNEGNKALNDLNSSLQFIYQLLTQLRAEVTTDGQNTVTWPEQTVSKWHSRCQQDFSGLSGNLNAACSCQVDKLASTYTSRQMELIEDLQSHPYSATSAALIRFKERSKNINKSCALSPV